MEPNYSPLKTLVRRHTGQLLESEYRFHPTREWRFDFALPLCRVAIEVEGGMYAAGGGRHFSPEGILRDLEKYNEAAASGWLVIRVVPTELLSVRTLQLIVRAINHRGRGG